jgi:hypothetical protein
MEKDIGKITKNPEIDIVIRVDDFGGKMGLTIREFVTSESYTGFTRAGVRISSENFEKFKELINSINPDDLKEAPVETPKEQETLQTDKADKTDESEEEASGIDSEGLM